MYGNVFLGLESTSYLKLPCIPNPETSQLAWRWGLSSVGVWCQCFGQHLWSSTGGKHLNIRFFLNQAAGVVHVFWLLFFFFDLPIPTWLAIHPLQVRLSWLHLTPWTPWCWDPSKLSWRVERPPKKKRRAGSRTKRERPFGLLRKNMESDWVLTDVADVYF